MSNVVTESVVAERAAEIFRAGGPENVMRVDACVRHALHEQGWKLRPDEGYPRHFYDATVSLLGLAPE